ncbi:substrate-binding periplasmic protein [Chitinimonas lacunae]|uniref:Substrate-binding periplasmic protein n=1 Tax=Chitinimonas lacunae TaxID=1963018 RepID=A0ABV8MR41_9NEIS
MFSILALPLLLIALPPRPGWPPGSPLLACDDINQWPPYTYRDNGALIGYSVDVLQQIAHAQQWRVQIDLLPWERCLNAVRAGQYHLALNASDNQQRRRHYLMTRPYYFTHSVYFYSRRHHSELDIHQLADLRRYRLCGLFGYNYEPYGLSTHDLDLGTTRFPQLIAKLHLGRCDLFVEKREIIVGFSLTDPEMNALLRDPQLQQRPLPGVAPTGFHMLISRRIQAAETLHAILEQGLDDMARRGRLTRLLRRYGVENQPIPEGMDRKQQQR